MGGGGAPSESREGVGARTEGGAKIEGKVGAGGKKEEQEEKEEREEQEEYKEQEETIPAPPAISLLEERAASKLGGVRGDRQAVGTCRSGRRFGTFRGFLFQEWFMV